MPMLLRHTDTHWVTIVEYLLTGVSMLLTIFLLFFVFYRVYFGNTLTIPNQQITDSIEVSMRITSPKGGFLVISKIERGNISDWLLVTRTRYVPPGSYVSVQVPILPDTEVGPDKIGGSTLIGMLFEDTNGNTILDDALTDRQFRSLWGTPIQTIFQETSVPPQSQEVPTL